MPDLPFTHGAHGGYVERSAFVGVDVTQLTEFFAELYVACDGSQFDECLSFISPCRTIGCVVGAERIEWDSHTACLAVRSQLQVYLEDAILTCLHGIKDRPHKLFKVVSVVHGIRAVRAAIASVDEHQLDIGGEAQFTSAALAEGEER